eukprot:jgi/Tetstr1/461401/TSEL_006513.t1
MCIIGSAGSGKTSLAVNLLTSKQAYKRAFHHVHVVMPPRSVESLKRNVFKSHDKMYPELDYGTLDTIKGRVMESAEKKEYSLLFMDDVTVALKDKDIQPAIPGIGPEAAAFSASVGASAKGVGNLAGVAEDALKGRGLDIGAAKAGFDQAKRGPRSVGGMKVRHNLPPINGREFSPGDTIEFSIPCGNKGEFLNTKQSYLKFKLKNEDGTNDMTLDFSASAVIRLLECVYGSSVLEYVDQYGLLRNILSDAQSTSTNENFGSTVVEGVSAADYRTGADIGSGTTVTFCIPLLSGVVGTLQHKYLPVGDMSRDRLRLNLTLANVNDAQVSTTACPWKVYDPEMVTEVIKLNSEANIGDGTKNTLSSRANLFGDVGRWSYDCGGILYPQRPVDTNAEAYMELQKAFHALGALDHGVINNATWTADAGTYIIAQDLELQHGKSSVSENGIDMSTSLIYLRAQFASGLGAAQRIDTFTHIDAVLFIDPTGMAQTVF